MNKTTRETATVPPLKKALPVRARRARTAGSSTLNLPGILAQIKCGVSLSAVGVKCFQELCPGEKYLALTAFDLLARLVLSSLPLLGPEVGLVFVRLYLYRAPDGLVPCVSHRHPF